MSTVAFLGAGGIKADATIERDFEPSFKLALAGKDAALDGELADRTGSICRFPARSATGSRPEPRGTPTRTAPRCS